MGFDASRYGKAKWSIRWVGMHKMPHRDGDGEIRPRYRWWLTARGPNYRYVLLGPIRLHIPRPWTLSRVFHDGREDGIDQVRSWNDEERALRLRRYDA